MTISTYRKATALVLAIFMAAMVLVIPQTSRAAFDDVSLSTNVGVTVGAIALLVAGSTDTVESLSVTSTTVSFTLEAGSTVRLTSAARAAFSHNAPSNFLASQACESSTSDIQITAPSGTSETTITITPSQSATCAVIGGGGGGGGGGSSTTTTSSTTTATSTTSTTTTTTPTTTTTTTTTTTDTEAGVRAQLQAQLNSLMAQLNVLLGKPNANAQANASANASFNRDLQVGSTGEDVKALQVWLNAKGYMVASSGAGSPGNETTRFGAATRAALAKYQKANGISPAAGYFGAKTRAHVSMNP